ncbi:M48 family metallopeptidase [Streptomyces cacaoi]
MTATDRPAARVVRDRRIDVFAHPRNTLLLFLLLFIAVCVYMETAVGYAEQQFSGGSGERVIPNTHIPYVVAYGVWWLVVFGTEMSWRVVRNRGRRPLDLMRHPLAAQRIDELASEVGLKRRPRLFVVPRIGDQAFVGGSTWMPVWRPYLVVGPGLLALGDRRDDTACQIFTAVVSHELAHLRNRDVMLLHLLAGLRCSNLVSALLFTYLLTLDTAGQGHTGLLFGALTLTLFALLIELIIREMLRCRENYADLRAARTRPQELELALRLAERKRTHVAPRRLGRAVLTAWWKCHPSVRARLRLLAEPGGLLRLPWLYVLLGGVLAGVSCVTVAASMSNRLHIDPSEKATFFFTNLLVGAPLGSFMAVGVWRQERHGSSSFARSLADAAARVMLLAIGFIVGCRLTPLTPYGRVYNDATLTLEPVLPWSLGALLCGCVTLVGWPHLAARALRLIRPRAGPAGWLFWWPLTLTAATAGFAVFYFLPLLEMTFPAVPAATQGLFP